VGNGSYGTKIWSIFVLPDGSIWFSDKGFRIDFWSYFWLRYPLLIDDWCSHRQLGGELGQDLTFFLVSCHTFCGVASVRKAENVWIIHTVFSLLYVVSVERRSDC
jgi:hypothetical protein